MQLHSFVKYRAEPSLADNEPLRMKVTLFAESQG